MTICQELYIQGLVSCGSNDKMQLGNRLFFNFLIYRFSLVSYVPPFSSTYTPDYSLSYIIDQWIDGKIDKRENLAPGTN